MDGVGSGTDGGGATAASVSAMLCSRNLATMMALLVLSTSTEEDEVSLAVVFLSLISQCHPLLFGGPLLGCYIQ